MIKVLGMLLVALASGQSAPSDRRPSCLQYEPNITQITGTLTPRTFYGPPGFGDDPAHDQKEPGFYLELPSPICMADGGDDVNVAQADVRLVQIVLDRRGYERLRPSLGQTVTLRGTMSGAITGHHHAPVLLTPVATVRVER